MEEIIPEQTSNKQEGKPVPVKSSFWFRFWVGLWLLIIFIQYFESFAVDRFLVQLMLAYFFIKRHEWARMAVTFLSFAGFSILFAVSWITRNEIGWGQHFFWRFYAVFYLGFFIFLSRTNMRVFFEREEKKILSNDEVRKIVAKVRLCALVLFLIGILEVLPFFNLKQYGMQTDGLIACFIYTTTAVGIYFLFDVARLFTIFLGFGALIIFIIEWLNHALKSFTQEWFDIFISSIIFSIALFFLNPKIRAAFKYKIVRNNT